MYTSRTPATIFTLFSEEYDASHCSTPAVPIPCCRRRCPLQRDDDATVLGREVKRAKRSMEAEHAVLLADRDSTIRQLSGVCSSTCARVGLRACLVAFPVCCRACVFPPLFSCISCCGVARWVGFASGHGELLMFPRVLTTPQPSARFDSWNVYPC